jgi:hypothetical protein
MASKLKATLLGFAASLLIMAVAFVGYTAYQDHKVVQAVKLLATEVGTADGKPVTATDIAALIISERLKQLEAAKAQQK